MLDTYDKERQYVEYILCKKLYVVRFKLFIMLPHNKLKLFVVMFLIMNNDTVMIRKNKSNIFYCSSRSLQIKSFPVKCNFLIT